MDKSLAWDVEQYPGFEFRGWTGNRATTDLTVIGRGIETPIVVATERDDNPGVSITNAAEYLAAEVLAKIVPERAREVEPFIFLEHHRAKSFHVGNGEFEGLENTFYQVDFTDFEMRKVHGLNRIGEAVSWGPPVEDWLRDFLENGLRDIVVEASVKQPELTPGEREAVRQVLAAAFNAQQNVVTTENDVELQEHRSRGLRV